MFKELGVMAAAALMETFLPSIPARANQIGPGRRSGGVTTHFDPVRSRHSGDHHEHKREIARNTTAPGSAARRAAYMAAQGGH